MLASSNVWLDRTRGSEDWSQDWMLGTRARRRVQFGKTWLSWLMNNDHDIPSVRVPASYPEEEETWRRLKDRVGSSGRNFNCKGNVSSIEFGASSCRSGKTLWTILFNRNIKKLSAAFPDVNFVIFLLLHDSLSISYSSWWLNLQNFGCAKVDPECSSSPISQTSPPTMSPWSGTFCIAMNLLSISWAQPPFHAWWQDRVHLLWSVRSGLHLSLLLCAWNARSYAWGAGGNVYGRGSSKEIPDVRMSRTDGWGDEEGISIEWTGGCFWCYPGPESSNHGKDSSWAISPHVVATFNRWSDPIIDLRDMIEHLESCDNPKECNYEYEQDSSAEIERPPARTLTPRSVVRPLLLTFG